MHKLIHLRKSHPTFSRKHWFQGKPIHEENQADIADIAWFLPEGYEMSEEHWKADFAKSLAVFLFGNGLNTVDENNQPVRDDSLYIIFNGDFEKVDYKLPVEKSGRTWKVVMTTEDHDDREQKEYAAGETITACDRCVMLLQSVPDI